MSFAHVISSSYDDCHLDSWCIRFWSKLPPECHLLRIIEINFIKSVAVDYVPSIKSNLGQIDAPDVNGRIWIRMPTAWMFYFFFTWSSYNLLCLTISLSLRSISIPISASRLISIREYIRSVCRNFLWVETFCLLSGNINVNASRLPKSLQIAHADRTRTDQWNRDR